MITLIPIYQCTAEDTKDWDWNCIMKSVFQSGKCKTCGSKLELNWMASDKESNRLLNEREFKREQAIERAKKACCKACVLLIRSEKESVIKEHVNRLREHPDVQFRRLTPEEIADFESFILYATRPNSVSATEAFM